ncbi:hypothetical protein HPB49_006412 [Dermacentor silvarum]|uniref:Uncharacterized protein n=1 Tax=Dermacentor silvarum TaxID=543639 RepID=A0ACB8DMY1_DERSI|nr:hypothetical protein HPB49_006412 [Dermacentor silvarum]
MQDTRTSRHRHSSAIPNATAPNRVCCKDTGHRLFYCGCGLAVVLFAVFGAVSINIYLDHHSRREYEVPFCCPREAHEVSRYVNSTINPCKDFFAYVCSNVISDKLSASDDHDFQIIYSLITGTEKDGVNKGHAGRFLTSYFTSCVEAVPRPKSFLYSLANALLQHEFKHLRHLDTGGVLAYFLASSVKYRMPSAVQVSFSPNRQLVSLTINMICNVRNDSTAVRATVDALKKHSDITLKGQDVTNFGVKLCRKFMAYGRRKRTYAMPSESHLFNQEVWQVKDLEDGLGPYGYRLQNSMFVKVDGFDQIRHLHSEFAAQDDGSETAATKIAYLVWHSVVHGSRIFYDVYDGSHPGAFRNCLDSLNYIWEAWDTFAAEMLTDRSTDAEAQAVFTAVKRTVHADCNSSMLFDVEDSEQLRTFLENLVLVTPTDASQLSSVTVPNGTDDIGENLLRGRVYSYEAAAARKLGQDSTNVVEYGLVQFRGDMHLLLPLSAYVHIGLGTSSHDLPDLALLGRMFADSLWYKMLGHMTWNAKTRSNIHNLIACLEKEDRMSSKGVPPDQLAVKVLGLLSTLNTLKKTADWDVPKVTETLWRMSEAQLFFILSTYKRCPTSWSSDDAHLVNAPLLYVDDFAKAFRCPTKVPAAQIRQCFPQTSHQV